MNAEVVQRLERRGHRDVRLAHNALLANLERKGNPISVVAARASMTKQAMGQLASELEARGYLTRTSDPADARVRLLCFTEAGWTLMLDTFEAIEHIEQSFARVVGLKRLNQLRSALDAFDAAFNHEAGIDEEAHAVSRSVSTRSG